MEILLLPSYPGKHISSIGPRFAGEIHADTNDFSYRDFLSGS